MPRPPRRPLGRDELPATFTPETLRDLDMWTLRRLSQRGNGVLSPDEQLQFDAALRETMRGTTDRLDRSLRGGGRPEAFDPELRRSYQRTRARLAAQAERARASFPPVAAELDAAPDVEPATSEDTADDDVSLAAFESEVEQTSDMLTLLERIASIEQQQLEHSRAQAVRDTRSLFFGLLVSMAVIVAGVAPLVEAEPSQRRQILLWTLVICAVAGVAYAVVRVVEARRD